MQKDMEVLKGAIWLTVGLIIGAVVMVSVQYWSIIANSDKGDGLEKSASLESSQNTVAVPCAPVQATANTTPPELVPVPSPYPVSTALAALNGTSRSAVQVQTAVDPQAPTLAPGTVLSESTNGYPIVTGGRAVDSPYRNIDPETNTELPPQQVGRSGLLSNPCVDPPSVHGLAYGRSY